MLFPVRLNGYCLVGFITEHHRAALCLFFQVKFSCQLSLVPTKATKNSFYLCCDVHSDRIEDGWRVPRNVAKTSQIQAPPSLQIHLHEIRTESFILCLIWAGTCPKSSTFLSSLRSGQPLRRNERIWEAFKTAPVFMNDGHLFLQLTFFLTHFNTHYLCSVPPFP